MAKIKPTKPTPKKRATAAQPASPALNTSWHAKFLEILGTTCNVTLAARGAGINRWTAYEHRKLLSDFAAQWDDAKEAAIEILEAEAWQRARKQSDTLMIFLLKAHKPDKYRERYESHSVNVNIDWDSLTDAELEQIAGGANPASVLANRSAKTD
jgi:hypothetical protein